ncbi:hypothetical protein OS493_030401 [Desmophyllum pertusum]|uniref:Uncharacterized protein n=1 Tax=Desmophyllum pertusum TaxID=174260 RepID=A0A9X0CVK8_9CNID|nr:hypothetical protein OS493_030401 [Desmophyllum pertusum]
MMRENKDFDVIPLKVSQATAVQDFDQKLAAQLEQTRNDKLMQPIYVLSNDSTNACAFLSLKIVDRILTELGIEELPFADGVLSVGGRQKLYSKLSQLGCGNFAAIFTSDPLTIPCRHPSSYLETWDCYRYCDGRKRKPTRGLDVTLPLVMETTVPRVKSKDDAPPVEKEEKEARVSASRKYVDIKCVLPAFT